MPTETLKYPAGTILMLETGDYSSFGYIGGFVTLGDLDLREAVETYKSEYTPKDKWDKPEASGFVAWLVMTQRCAPLEYQTAHIGDNARLEV